jgi:hypothetical protein
MTLLEQAIDLINKELDNLEHSVSLSVKRRLETIAEELRQIENNL